MNRHLVAVEVGVERCTCEGVELNCLTFNHLRLEGLDTETVKRRSTVEEHGVTLHYVFEDVPNDRLATVNNALSTLYCLHDTALNELADDEWLIKFGSHELGNTTFAHLQFRTNNDNRTR